MYKNKKLNNKKYVGADASVCPILGKTQNNGITLIALIITIIVMLILVAVTVSMAINGGLFEKAGESVGKTKNEINKEQELANGKIKIGDKWYASIDDYLNNNPIVQGVTVESKLKLTIPDGYNAETAPVTGQLTATLNEVTGTPTWSSNNEGVAKVSQTGLVTAVAEGTAEITASLAYGGENYTDKCTVTVEGPKVEFTSADLPTTEYGKTVNYGATYTDASSYGEEKWEILYADENHIYLITKGHLASAALSTTGYTGTADFTEANLSTKFPAVKQGLLNKTYDPLSVGSELKYTSGYDNMKATEYLLDSTNSKWSSLVDSDYADWAIGAPTYELFVKSYNAYYTDKPDVELATPSGNGYDNPLSAHNSVPTGTHLSHSSSTYYWLACPSSNYSYNVCDVNGYYAYVYYGNFSYFLAFRPVVCLKSGVSVKWNSTTNQYDLVK